MIGLVDCNSFYCSCERVFHPQTRRRPIIVLSNNDGCAIAFSREAKVISLGQMCEPFFELQDRVKKHNIAVFSSNYTLYDDMSKRVMTILSRYTHDLEVYSVDEAFLDFTGRHEDLLTLGTEIREDILRSTGLHVGVGISKTKVLSKVANKISKNGSGVTLLDTDEKINQALKNFPVQDLWGIGRASATKLLTLGIRTALEFKNYNNDKIIQKLLTKTGRQVQDELRGINCFEMEEIEDKRNIATTRSFARAVYSKKELQEALATFATKACEKLRFQNSTCLEVSIFLTAKLYENSCFITSRFENGTCDTFKIITRTHELLDQVFQTDVGYKKAGVILGQIQPTSVEQLNFFNNEPSDNTKLIETIDKINAKFGPQAVKSAACGTNPKWGLIANHKSKRFTTNWDELLTVS